MSYFNIAVLFLAGAGAFAVGLYLDRTSSFDDGSFIWQILLMIVGLLAMGAAVVCALVLHVMGGS